MYCTECQNACLHMRWICSFKMVFVVDKIVDEHNESVYNVATLLFFFGFVFYLTDIFREL